MRVVVRNSTGCCSRSERSRAVATIARASSTEEGSSIGRPANRA